MDRAWDDTVEQGRSVYDVISGAITEYLDSLPESERKQERSRIATAKAYQIIKLASLFDEQIEDAATDEEHDYYMELQERYRQWLWHEPLYYEERMRALEMVADEYIEQELGKEPDDTFEMTEKELRQRMLNFWTEVKEPIATNVNDFNV